MQFHGRDIAYRLYDDSVPPMDRPQINVALPPAPTTMTWQQKKDFRSTTKSGVCKSKGVHWKQVAFTDAPDPPVILSVDTSFSHTIKAPIVRLPGPSSFKVAASAPHTLDKTPAINPSLQKPIPANNAKTTQKKPRKRSSRSRHIKEKQQDMAVLPRSAYVPPHLRQRAAATPEAVANETGAPCVQKGTTKTSVKSNAESTDRNHKLLNESGLVWKQLSSATITPPARKLEKSNSVQGVQRIDSPQAVVDTEDVELAPLTDFPCSDTTKPEPTSSTVKPEQPRWPRGPKPQQKKTVWPKNRDMKAISTDSSSDGGTACRSDSNGDPDYDVKKLMDWNGDWLPPPEQWSARRGHTNRHFGRVIEDWINGHDDECTKDMEIDSHIGGQGCKEIVPRYWIITKIEQDSLSTFWKRFTERAPSPVSGIDTMADPPFWERYEDAISPYNNGLIVPEASVDPDDPENNTGIVDLLISAAEKVRLIDEKKARAQARILAKQRRPPRELAPAEPPQEVRRIRPKSNVYFRPIQPADIEGIAAIYNHYVETTIYAPEFDGRYAEDIAQRADAIIENGLPFLVAVARGNQRRGPKGYISEKIVGFTYLTDWHDQSSIYRYTFRLELYVHPGYTSQNIASCLLDRLLEMANTGYNARGGYEYRNEFEYLRTGPSRVIKTIILHALKESGERSEETSKFLKQFNFSCAGHIANIGFKLGKTIDVFLYRHTTTEAIDPNARPTIAS